MKTSGGRFSFSSNKTLFLIFSLLVLTICSMLRVVLTSLLSTSSLFSELSFAVLSPGTVLLYDQHIVHTISTSVHLITILASTLLLTSTIISYRRQRLGWPGSDKHSTTPRECVQNITRRGEGFKLIPKHP